MPYEGIVQLRLWGKGDNFLTIKLLIECDATYLPSAGNVDVSSVAVFYSSAS